VLGGIGPDVLNRWADEQLVITIGDAVFRITGRCKPCGLPSQVSGTPGFLEAFADRGGARAEVLQPGLLVAEQPFLYLV